MRFAILLIVLFLWAVLVIYDPVFFPAMLIFFVFIFWFISWGINLLNGQVVRQLNLLNKQLNIYLKIPEHKMFSLEWKYPFMTGNFLNRSLNIFMYVTNRIGYPLPHTIVTIDVLHYGKTFSLKTESITTRAKRMAGMNDVIIGDPEFDDLFYIETNDPGFVGSLLEDDDIRELMIRHLNLNNARITLEQSQLKYDEQVILNTTEKRKRFEKVILLLYMLIKRMENTR